MTHHRERLVRRQGLSWGLGAALASLLAGCGGGSSAPAAAPGAYAVSGTVSGLPAGASVTVEDNASDTLTLSANGPFTFRTTLASASAYAVTVLRHTVGVSCSVAQGSGSVGPGSVTGVAVQCGRGTETLLHSFGATGSPDGAGGVALTMDSAGDLYGTTPQGGANGTGVIFEIPKTPGGYGAEVVVFNFDAYGNNATGDLPGAGLLIDSAGNLYGTTTVGGANNAGVVYEIPKTASGYGAEVLLATFAAYGSNATGAEPYSGLTMDGAGNLFGTTYYGGANNAGVVYEIPKTAGGYGPEVVLTSFAALGPNATGAFPIAGVTLDNAGNLYGTTFDGGANNTGAVYEIPKTASGYGPEVLLASFGISGDNSTGSNARGGLSLDSAGNLYGTTEAGGANNGGAVYEIPKTAGGYGPEVLLASFGTSANNTTGDSPWAGVTLDGAGNLYGTTMFGGANNNGVVYAIPKTASGYGAEVVLATFAASPASATGSDPQAPVVLDGAGNLYGATDTGGANGNGTVFQIN